MGGERPLFASHDLKLDNVTITAGESGIKCCSNIVAENCRFEGKYPFWHVDGFKIHNCLFTPGARAALWYSRDLEMTDTVVDAPKMFREMEKLTLNNVKLNDALETFWHTSKVKLEDVEGLAAKRNVRFKPSLKFGNAHKARRTRRAIFIIHLTSCAKFLERRKG